MGECWKFLQIGVACDPEEFTKLPEAENMAVVEDVGSGETHAQCCQHRSRISGTIFYHRNFG